MGQCKASLVSSACSLCMHLTSWMNNSCGKNCNDDSVLPRIFFLFLSSFDSMISCVLAEDVWAEKFR